MNTSVDIGGRWQERRARWTEASADDSMPCVVTEERGVRPASTKSRGRRTHSLKCSVDDDSRDRLRWVSRDRRISDHGSAERPHPRPCLHDQGTVHLVGGWRSKHRDAKARAKAFPVPARSRKRLRGTATAVRGLVSSGKKAQGSIGPGRVATPGRRNGLGRGARPRGRHVSKLPDCRGNAADRRQGTATARGYRTRKRGKAADEGKASEGGVANRSTQESLLAGSRVAGIRGEPHGRQQGETDLRAGSRRKPSESGGTAWTERPRHLACARRRGRESLLSRPWEWTRTSHTAEGHL